MSTSKDAQSVMDEYPTSLTPRGRALLISKRARRYYQSREREDPEAVKDFLFALLGPSFMQADIGRHPDDLQLETMEQIRRLVQYPIDPSDEREHGNGMRNPVPMDLRRTYDYLTVEELRLRFNTQNPHIRHLITFDFLAQYGYMTIEEVILRFSALSSDDKSFIDNSPEILQDEEYIARHPSRCNCPNTNDEPCADKILLKALSQMLRTKATYSLRYVLEHFFNSQHRGVHPSIIRELFACGDVPLMNLFFTYSDRADFHPSVPPLPEYTDQPHPSAAWMRLVAEICRYRLHAPIVAVFSAVLESHPPVHVFRDSERLIHEVYEVNGNDRLNYSLGYLWSVLNNTNAEDWMRYIVGTHARSPEDLRVVVTGILMHRSKFFLPMLEVMRSEFNITWQDIGLQTALIRIKSLTDPYISRIFPILQSRYGM
eukprot:6214077-Pleurochrysis_carterae.AAC.1